MTTVFLGMTRVVLGLVFICSVWTAGTWVHGFPNAVAPLTVCVVCLVLLVLVSIVTPAQWDACLAQLARKPADNQPIVPPGLDSRA
jgi:hypothetical protein